MLPTWACLQGHPLEYRQPTSGHAPEEKFISMTLKNPITLMSQKCSLPLERNTASKSEGYDLEQMFSNLDYHSNQGHTHTEFSYIGVDFIIQFLIQTI